MRIALPNPLIFHHGRLSGHDPYLRFNWTYIANPHRHWKTKPLLDKTHGLHVDPGYLLQFVTELLNTRGISFKN